MGLRSIWSRHYPRTIRSKYVSLYLRKLVSLYHNKTIRYPCRSGRYLLRSAQKVQLKVSSVRLRTVRETPESLVVGLCEADRVEGGRVGADRAVPDPLARVMSVTVRFRAIVVWSLEDHRLFN